MTPPKLPSRTGLMRTIALGATAGVGGFLLVMLGAVSGLETAVQAQQQSATVGMEFIPGTVLAGVVLMGIGLVLTVLGIIRLAARAAQIKAAHELASGSGA